MKAILLTAVCSLFLMTGCSNMGCGGGCCGSSCGYTYYSYGSSCGYPSCTDAYVPTTTYYNSYSGCGYGVC